MNEQTAPSTFWVKRHPYLTASGLIFILITFFAVQFVLAGLKYFDRFGSEDEIVHVGVDIATAIDTYTKEQGYPPESLDTLVPDTVASIPTNQYIDRIEYQLDDTDQTWTLQIYSDYLDDPRIYFQRSDGEIRPEESERSLGVIHGWLVLRDETHIESSKN